MCEEVSRASTLRPLGPRVVEMPGQPLNERVARGPVERRAGERVLSLDPRPRLRAVIALEPSIRIGDRNAMENVDDL